MSTLKFDPVYPLPNSRHEAFAQILLRGVSATQAYALAGYKPSSSRASRLRASQAIKARLTYLGRHHKPRYRRFKASDEDRCRRQIERAQGLLEHSRHINRTTPLARRFLEEVQAMASGERPAVKEMVCERVGDGPNRLVKVTHF